MLFRIVRLLCIIFLFATATPGPVGAGITADQLQTLATEAPPLDVVIPASGKFIFILTEGGRVNVLGPDGRILGNISVPATVEGIEASPDGNFLFLRDRQSKNIQIVAVEFVAEIDTAKAPFLGKAEAPLVIAVYSDFQCPFCARLKPILEQVLENHPDEVRVVFKHFPLAMHEYAFSAAVSAAAAQEQGKFWEFHDALFVEHKNLSAEKIVEIARGLQLDMDRFLLDRESESLRRRVEQDKKEGEGNLVGSTPSVFVNGRRVQRLTVEGLERAVARELERITNQKPGSEEPAS